MGIGEEKLARQSTITDNNAEQFALQAYQAGDLSASTVSILGTSGSGNPATDRPKVLTLVRLLKDATEKTPVPAGSSVRTNSSTRALPMTVVTIDNTIFDGSDGSMSFTLSADDQTGEFTGTFRFDNWHGDGVEVISGLANVSGRIYLPNSGYVDVSTTASFRYSSGYMLPASAVFVVTGSGGRSARLTVIDAVPESSGYYVEADVDGIPGYEWRSIDHPWT